MADFSTSTPELWNQVWEDSREDEFWKWVKRESNGVRGKKILDYINRYLGSVENLKIVEVGSGTGIYSFILGSFGAEVTLIDYNVRALELAKHYYSKEKIKAHFIQGDALSLDSNLLTSFDVAMSFGTIEHYKPPERFLMAKVHYDLLKPKGVVAISVPNKWFVPHEALKFFLQRQGKWYLGYEGAFTRLELGHVGRKLQLKNVEICGSAFLTDAKRYLGILANTQSFGRWMPQSLRTWALPVKDTASLLDDLLGSDLVLLGQKQA